MSCLCCASIGLSCCGCASAKACGECKPSSNGSRYPYAGITITASLVAILLQKVGHENFIGNWALCDMIRMKTCSDNAGVQRIFFGLTLFFIIHAITIKFWPDFHKLYWFSKLLITTLVIFLLFFIDNPPFEAYSHFARYMAAFYLIFQIVIYINMLYDWNENWVAEEKFKSILCMSLILYIIAIVFFVISFLNFASNDQICIRNTTVLSLAIVFCVIFSILSVMVPHGAILPSAGVTAYVSYLLYNGLSYDTNKVCNLSAFRDHTSIQVIIGLIMICISVGYFVATNSPRLIDSNNNKINDNDGMNVNSKLNTGTDENDIELGTRNAVKNSEKRDNNNNNNENENGNDSSNYDENNNAAIKTGNYEDSSENEENDNNNGEMNNENNGKQYQSVNITFHLLMCLACFYILMVFTAWQTESHARGDQSLTILWINVATQWAVIVLYIVTLIAPSICPDRFNNDESDY